MTWHCPVCDAESTKSYRCSECGADLAGKSNSTGRREIA